jgi:hypothetical protein
MRQFRVTGPCLANVPTSGPLGEIRRTLYRDALFDGDQVDGELLALWERRGLAEPVEAPAAKQSAAPKADDNPPAVTAKSTKAELVEYGVAKGDDRAELEKLKVDELRDRYVPKQP